MVAPALSTSHENRSHQIKNPSVTTTTLDPADVTLLDDKLLSVKNGKHSWAQCTKTTHGLIIKQCTRKLHVKMLVILCLVSVQFSSLLG